MQDNPEQVAIIGDDVNADLGAGAVELGLHRYLGTWINQQYLRAETNVAPIQCGQENTDQEMRTLHKERYMFLIQW